MQAANYHKQAPRDAVRGDRRNDAALQAKTSAEFHATHPGSRPALAA